VLLFGEMEYRDKRDEWLRRVDADKRKAVFPHTANQDIERLQRLKYPPLTVWAKIIYTFLVLCLLALVFKFYREGQLLTVMVLLGVTAVLFLGPIFALIAWSTHKNLREIRDLKRHHRIRH
jgi:fatty acid desaturase